MDLEHEQRLTAVEERSKSNSHRLDKLEESNEVISRLATSMEVMANKQEQVADTVDKLDGKVTALKVEIMELGEPDEKVTALERKPGKRWDGFVEKLIWAIAAAIVGFVLAQIGLG